MVDLLDLSRTPLPPNPLLSRGGELFSGQLASSSNLSPSKSRTWRGRLSSTSARATTPPGWISAIASPMHSPRSPSSRSAKKVYRILEEQHDIEDIMLQNLD